jgi:hflC protein
VYANIEKGRDVLAAEILKKANMQLEDFGIEVIDVIFKEIKYSDELQASVYNRMIKERNQIAQTFRSTGEGKKAEWLGKLENEKKSILSRAYSESEKIKGAADAQATAIYAASYGKSPEFYSFWKSLEVYQNALPDTEKILSTDMEYFQYLYNH